MMSESSLFSAFLVALLIGCGLGEVLILLTR